MMNQIQKTLLMVDNSARNRADYQRYLQHNPEVSYSFLEAEDGETGLELCQNYRPDAIILADELPDLQAIDWIERLQQQSGKRYLPIVILITPGNEENALEGIKRGAQSYLSYSQVTPTTLENAIATTIERVCLVEALERAQEQRRIIASISLHLRSTRPLNEVLESAAQQVQQFLDCDRVLIHQFNSSTSGQIVAEATRSPWLSLADIELDPREKAAFPEFVAKYAQNCPHIIYNLPENDDYTPAQKRILDRFQVQACLAIPITLTDHPELAKESPESPTTATPWGLLIAHQCSSPRQWQESELELLDELALQMAIAIQQALLFEQLQHQNQALKASEQRFFQAVEGINDGIWEWNVPTNQVYYSPRWKNILGYEDEEFPSVVTNWSSRVHPDDFPRLQQMVKDYASRKISTYKVEYRLRHKDGQYRWILAQAVGMWDEQNQLVRLTGSHTDVTERKQAVEQLQASEARFRLLAENSSDIIARTTLSGEILYISPACQSILGYSPQELTGTCSSTLLHPEDLAAIRASSAEEILSQSTCTFRARHKQGHYVWLEANTRPIRNLADSNEIELQSTVRDITDRKAIEEERTRLVTILEATPDFVSIGNVKFENVWSNHQIRRLYPDLGDREYEQKVVADFHPAWALAILQQEGIPTAIREGVWRGETALIDQDGQEIPVSQIIIAHRSPQGEIEYFSTIMHDIRDRVAAETELRRREKMLRDLLDSLHSFVGLMTADGILIEANHAPLRAAGLEYEEVIGKPFVEAYWWSHSPQAQSQLRNAIARALAKESVRYDAQVQVAENQFITIDFTISPICDEQGTVRYLVPSGIDITERRQAEEALLQSEARLKYLLSASPTTIYTCKAEGDFGATSMSDNVKAQFGHDPEEFTRDSSFWANNIHPEDRDRVFEGLSTLFENGYYNHEYRFRVKDGSYRWVRDDLKLIRDARALPIEIIGSWLDISDRKHSEALLQKRDTYLSALVQIQSQLLQGVTEEIQLYDRVLPVLGEVAGVDNVYVFENQIGKRGDLRMHCVWEWCKPGRATNKSDFRFRVLPYSAFPGWAETLASGEAIAKVASDYSESEARILDNCGIKALLLLPLQVNHEFFGFLGFDNTREEQVWETQQIGLLQLAVNAIALAKERQLSSAKLQLQFAAIEAATDGIAITDAEGAYLYLNRMHIQLFGYSHRSELVGKPWTVMYYPDEANRLKHDIFSKLKKSQTWRGEGLARRKDGSTFPEEFSLTLMPSGELVCVCRDISDRKRADEQMRQTNQRLARINAELERATRLKDEFLANMSHELRTPLNAILGLSEALQEEVYGTLSDRQRRSITTIEKSGKHLLELINDVLDLAKIESGKMELQLAPASVRHLAESSFTFVKQLAQRKNIQLKADLPPGDLMLEVDERRIRQALINLLSNAVKFTPDGGSITLKLNADVEAETVNFSVIDTGIGIEPENLQKLFKPFVQIDSSLSRSYAGTGLGLALVRRIAEVHGGSVAVDSELGNGSTFMLMLPWQSVVSTSPSPTPQGAPTQAGEVAIANNLALAIDDSSTAVEQVTRYLGELDLQTVAYPEGEGAVRLAERLKPGVIVLDLQLPTLSGWDVLKQLKENPATRDIPVIIISVAEEQSQAWELGAAEYLVKPISRQRLHAAIAKVTQIQTKTDSTALVVMPLPAAETPRAPSETQHPLILVAEDNDDNIATIWDYLLARKYRLIRAKNGWEALDRAETHQPQLILMDVQMPQMDGLEAIRRLRDHRDRTLAQTPIIALTALAMPGDRDRCLAAGANEYLTKPVSLKELVEAIEVQLNAD